MQEVLAFGKLYYLFTVYNGQLTVVQLLCLQSSFMHLQQNVMYSIHSRRLQPLSMVFLHAYPSYLEQSYTPRYNRKSGSSTYRSTVEH